MGLLSLFGKSPLSEKKITKVAKLAANPFAQPDVRMREMQRLVEDGSDAALRGVLRRFAANAQGHIADEDEKKWLEDALAKCGDGALAPLQDYIKTESKLTYALRALARIAGDDAAIDFFIDVLRLYGPDDHRSTEAKLQIIWQLAEHLEDPRVFSALVPFLRDHSDDVRWAVLDLLERVTEQAPLPEAAQDILGHMSYLVCDREVSPRIAKRAAELLAAREWALPGDHGALAQILEETFFLDKKHFVRRRVPKSVAG